VPRVRLWAKTKARYGGHSSLPGAHGTYTLGARQPRALLVQKKSLPRQIGIDRDTKTVDVAATCFICVSARLLMAST